MVVSVWRAGTWVTLATCGDLDAVRPWASVTKLGTALATAIDVQEGRAALDDELFAPGVTLAHVLSHSSGLGFEAGDPVVAPARKRVYSNCGIDIAAAHLSSGSDLDTWLRDRVIAPLRMSSVTLVGRASEGLVGSTRDLATFAREWVTPTLVTAQRRNMTITPYLPDLDGVVPGFGRFTPCPWGLGVEVRGEKRHWMGDWPPASFGHFGASGALALMNVDEGLCVVATSTKPFGAWAHDLWPTWTSSVREFGVTA